MLGALVVSGSACGEALEEDGDRYASSKALPSYGELIANYPNGDQELVLSEAFPTLSDKSKEIYRGKTCAIRMSLAFRRVGHYMSIITRAVDFQTYLKNNYGAPVAGMPGGMQAIIGFKTADLGAGGGLTGHIDIWTGSTCYNNVGCDGSMYASSQFWPLSGGGNQGPAASSNPGAGSAPRSGSLPCQVKYGVMSGSCPVNGSCRQGQVCGTIDCSPCPCIQSNGSSLSIEAGTTCADASSPPPASPQPAPPPATLPIKNCEAGLDCVLYGLNGAEACSSNGRTLFCCPRGLKVTGQGCSLPLCGPSRSCSSNQVDPRMEYCALNATLATFCCPGPQKLVNNTCQ
jgi:hypothetical protein